MTYTWGLAGIAVIGVEAGTLGVLALPENIRDKKPFFCVLAGCVSGATGSEGGSTLGAATILGGGMTGVGAGDGSGPALSSCAGLITRPSSTRAIPCRPR